jgi:uncharacterized caspase-like protein
LRRGSARRRPKLFALLVGVTGYENAAVLGDLQFPGRDAEGLADALLKQKDCLFGEVHTKIAYMPQDGAARQDRLGPPTRREVFEGLKWLKKSAGEKDTSIVFLDGHGWSKNDTFWFLTQEADEDDLVGTAVRDSDLLTFLRDVKGKKIVLLDSCHSGAALDLATRSKDPKAETRPNQDEVIRTLTRDSTGIVAYAAASSDGLDWEDAAFDRHGAFAEALIEAFRDGAGADHGVLMTSTLQEYLRKRVGELVAKIGKEQVPTWNKPQPVDDFPVAMSAKP